MKRRFTLNNVAWLVLLFVVVACVVAFVLRRGPSRSWLPQELRSAELVMIEENLRTNVPYRVVGRPDQVFKRADGVHIPLENMNRDVDRVYETDRAELSLQAWLLRRLGMRTADYGYVAIGIRGTSTRLVRRVDLMSDAQCASLIERHIAIVNGALQPRKSRGAKCKTCGHAQACFGIIASHLL
jgi:CRISPR-associated exonuclease Cas4